MAPLGKDRFIARVLVCWLSLMLVHLLNLAEETEASWPREADRPRTKKSGFVDAAKYRWSLAGSKDIKKPLFAVH